MKLYITNIPPSAIRNNQNKLTSYLTNKREIHEIYSEDYGLHIIDPKNKNPVYKVEAQFKTDYHLIKGHQYNNNQNKNQKDPTSCDLLFDLTVYQNVPVVSQLPVKYILTKIQRFSYKLNKKSNWKLIIDSIRETNPETMDKELIPINYYFEYSDNRNPNNINNTNKKEFKETIDELLFQDEINMFLSHLI
jgi:hypothetical protein